MMEHPVPMTRPMVPCAFKVSLVHYFKISLNYYKGKCVAAGCTKETGSGAYNQGNKCGICTTDKGYGGDDDGCQHVSRSDKKK